MFAFFCEHQNFLMSKKADFKILITLRMNLGHGQGILLCQLIACAPLVYFSVLTATFISITFIKPHLNSIRCRKTIEST